MKRLQPVALAADLHVLSDIDESRHIGILWPQRSRDHRADVRNRHRLRRRVPGVPLELVPGVQNEPQIAGLIRPDQRSSIHHSRDLLQPLRDLDVVHRRIDRRERAQHAIRFQPRFIRRVALRVEGFGLRHAPAIQSTINVSAVGSIFDAASLFGAPPASAANAAAAGICRKSRRRIADQICFSSRFILSPNELKLRQHHDAPDQVGQPLGRNFTRARQ